MPIFVIETNVKQEDFPEGWLSETTDLIADLLGKPKMYVMVHAVANQLMSMGGTTDPCACMNLSSIGQITEEKNRTYVTAISEFIEKTIKVPKDRMYVNFHDLRRDMVGRDGKLFC